MVRKDARAEKHVPIRTQRHRYAVYALSQPTVNVHTDWFKMIYQMCNVLRPWISSLVLAQQLIGPSR